MVVSALSFLPKMPLPEPTSPTTLRECGREYGGLRPKWDQLGLGDVSTSSQLLSYKPCIFARSRKILYSSG